MANTIASISLNILLKVETSTFNVYQLIYLWYKWDEREKKHSEKTFIIQFGNTNEQEAIIPDNYFYLRYNFCDAQKLSLSQ